MNILRGRELYTFGILIATLYDSWRQRSLRKLRRVEHVVLLSASLTVRAGHATAQRGGPGSCPVMHKVALGLVLLRVLRFSLSVSFHRGSPYSYTTWGNNRPIGSRSSETLTSLTRTATVQGGVKCSKHAEPFVCAE
jgi:hypothetical protein